MENFDKDHIANEAAFHMECYNQCLSEAARLDVEAEFAHSIGEKSACNFMAAQSRETAEGHLNLYNQKMATLNFFDPFHSQLVINSNGLLLHS